MILTASGSLLPSLVSICFDPLLIEKIGNTSLLTLIVLLNQREALHLSFVPRRLVVLHGESDVRLIPLIHLRLQIDFGPLYVLC